MYIDEFWFFKNIIIEDRGDNTHQNINAILGALEIMQSFGILSQLFFRVCHIFVRQTLSDIFAEFRDRCSLFLKNLNGQNQKEYDPDESESYLSSSLLSSSKQDDLPDDKLPTFSQTFGLNRGSSKINLHEPTVVKTQSVLRKDSGSEHGGMGAIKPPNSLNDS